MPDRYLEQVRDSLGEKAQILETQVVPAVDSQPAAYRLASRLDIWGDGRFAVGCVAFGIRLGVEFDAVGSGFGRGCDQFGTRVQKDGCPDTGAPEPADHLAQEALMLHGVPSGVRRDCIVGVGYERDLRRTDLEHQIDERADRISLDIELGGDRALDIAYVRVADMPLVGSRVDRNALRSETLRVESRLDDVRQIASSGIAQRGDLIYVHTQLCHIFP